MTIVHRITEVLLLDVYWLTIDVKIWLSSDLLQIALYDGRCHQAITSQLAILMNLLLGAVNNRSDG